MQEKASHGVVFRWQCKKGNCDEEVSWRTNVVFPGLNDQLWSWSSSFIAAEKSMLRLNFVMRTCKQEKFRPLTFPPTFEKYAHLTSIIIQSWLVFPVPLWKFMLQASETVGVWRHVVKLKKASFTKWQTALERRSSAASLLTSNRERRSFLTFGKLMAGLVTWKNSTWNTLLWITLKIVLILTPVLTRKWSRLNYW